MQLRVIKYFYSTFPDISNTVIIIKGYKIFFEGSKTWMGQASASSAEYKPIPITINSFSKSTDFSNSSGWKTLNAALPGTITSLQ